MSDSRLHGSSKPRGRSSGDRYTLPRAVRSLVVACTSPAVSCSASGAWTRMMRSMGMTSSAFAKYALYVAAHNKTITTVTTVYTRRRYFAISLALDLIARPCSRSRALPGSVALRNCMADNAGRVPRSRAERAQLLGCNESDVWMKDEYQMEGGYSVRDTRLPGLLAAFARMGVRSSDSRVSQQYLQLIVYGVLNSLARFNDPSATHPQIRDTILRAIGDLGQIPHWPSREVHSNGEEAFVAHALWLTQEPDYYKKTRINGNALLMIFRRTEEQDKVKEDTTKLWGSILPYVWQVLGTGVRDERIDTLKCEARARDAMARSASKELVHVRVMGPHVSVFCDNAPPIGEEPVLAEHVVKSRPNERIYEDVFTFASPLPVTAPARDERINASPSRLVWRRLYVRELVRWFVSYQCKLELAALHYAYLVRMGILPSENDWALRGSDANVPPLKRGVSMTHESTRPNAFQVILPYKLYNNVLSVHMGNIVRTCMPYVLDPVIALVNDHAWLEMFPISREEVMYFVAHLLDETYRARYYEAMVTERVITLEWARTYKLKHLSGSIGELSIIMSRHGVGATDAVLHEAYEMWDAFNEDNVEPYPHLRAKAKRTTTEYMKHVRRTLPRAADETLPSIRAPLEGIRRMVYARWHLWRERYSTFRTPYTDALKVKEFYNACIRVCPIAEKVNSQRRIRTWATFMCGVWSDCVACDVNGRAIVILRDIGCDVVVRNGTRHGEPLWSVDLNNAVSIAIETFRDHVLEYVCYTPYMRKVFEREQQNRELPCTYAADVADELRQLCLNHMMRYKVSSRGAEELSRMEQRTRARARYVAVLGIPHHRDWSKVKIRWTMTDERDIETTTTIESHLSGIYQIPDDWVLRNTDRTRDRRVLLEGVWSHFAAFQYKAPNSRGDVMIDYRFDVPCTMTVWIAN